MNKNKIIFFSKEKLLCKSQNYSLFYKSGFLYVKDKYHKIKSKVRIHPFYKSFHLFERILRLEPRLAVALSDREILYTDHGAVYKYDIEKEHIELTHKFSKGMNNPIGFCIRKDQNGKIIDIYYGEYIWNTEKGPVSIYRYDFEKWEVVFTFPKNTITHIHNIVYDKYNKRFLILTGDDDSESAIWVANEYFTEVSCLVGGSQQYRSCAAFPTEKGIFYATDTPIEKNCLYFLDSCGIRKVAEMPGPVIYSMIYNDDFFLATSVEGNPNQNTWKYRISNRIGPGVADRNVHIIQCDKYGRVFELARLKKDIYPLWLFQFGNAQFVRADDGIYLTTQSTREKGTYKLLC